MIKQIERVEDPADPSLFYMRTIPVKAAVTAAQECPWIGHLQSVSHDDGPQIAAERTNTNFTLCHSTMLTVPGVIYPDTLNAMTEHEFRQLCPVRTLGTFLSRSDTLEVVGYSSLRQTTVPPMACIDKFWDMCSAENFRVEGLGMVYNNTVLAIFARHAGDPLEIKGNRFIRYAYFLSAFGAGFTPMLVHAAYHVASGKLLLVDVQKIGSRRVRGLQVARKKVAGVSSTLDSFSFRRWNEDWFEYTKILQKMAETCAPPLIAARILTMSLHPGFAKLAVQEKLSRDVRGNMKRFPIYKDLLDRKLNALKESFISFTDGTFNTVLGAFIYGVFSSFKNKSQNQKSASYAIELSSSGLTKKRAIFNAARTVIYG